MNKIIVTSAEDKLEVRFVVDGTKDEFDQMLDDFKKVIISRKWQPDKKVWIVSDFCKITLKKWCLESQWWDNVVWDSEQIKYGGSKPPPGPQPGPPPGGKKKTSSPPGGKSPGFEDFVDFDSHDNGSKKLYAALYLTPDAPSELIEFVWKKLMMMYHPDKNPAPQAGAKATAVNAAYQEIKKLQGGKDV